MRWRIKQRQIKGEDGYKKEQAYKMKVYRRRKIIQDLDKQIASAQARVKPRSSSKGTDSDNKNFIKISTGKKIAKANKQEQHSESLKEAEEPEHQAKPAVMNLQDDIYSAGSSMKEGDISQPHLVFKHPFTCLIAGPTSSGKTVFTIKVLENMDEMIEPNVKEILWCYGIESPQLTTLKQKFPSILKLHKGLPDLAKLSALDTSVNRILLIDDLMQETKGNTVANLFSKGAHHLNMSVVYIVQNVFNQNKEMRNIFLNAQYKVLFNNPSDVTQLTVLNSRMFPGHPKFLKEVMRDAARKPHAHIVLDVHPRTPEDLRVRSEVFPGQDNNVFLPQ